MTQFPLGTVVGSDGADAPQIESIEKTSTSGLIDTYTITLDDGSEYTFEVTNGEDGSSVSVSQVVSSGTKIATLTIDGVDTDLFSPSGGSADIVTAWEQVLSDLKVPSEKLVKTTLDTKISKSNTSGLVKNDGTIDTTSYISSLPSASTSTQGIVQLVDNLTTSDDTKALTAKQGKALNDKIGTISNVLSNVITYINQ